MHALRLTFRFKAEDFQEDACLLAYDVNVLEGAIIGDDVRDHFNVRPSTTRIYILAPFIPENVVKKAMHEGAVFHRVRSYFSSFGGEISLLTFREVDGRLRPVSLPFIITDDGATEGDPKLIEKHLRDGWLFDLFDQNKGLVSAPVGVHFGKMSSKHSEQFLRTSGILLSSTCCATVAYFAHDVVAKFEPKRIFVDTAPLIAIVFAMQRIARVQKIWSLVVPTESFSSYGGVEQLPQASGREIVIVSASTSGGLVQRLEQKGYKREVVTTLFYLGATTDAPGDFPLVCDLTFRKGASCGYLPIKNYHATTCPLCDRGFFLAELEGDQFLLQKRAIKELSVRTKSQPGDARTVLEVLARQSLFAIPLFSSSTYGVAVSFNADEALNIEVIRNKFTKVLRRYLPAPLRYVVLVNLLQATFERVMAAAGLAGLLSETEFIPFGAIGRAVPVEGAGVAVIFGSLHDYSQARDINARLRVIAPEGCIAYLSLLTLAESKEHLASLKGFLTYGKSGRESFTYADAYQLQVPYSHDVRSAWDLELDLLRQIEDGMALEPELKERLTLLIDSAHGTDRLFLNGRSEELSIKEDFVYLTTTSETDGITQADIYVVVANLLACSRNGDRGLATAVDLQPVQWAQSLYGHTLLAVSNFNDYNDSILRAAFLRAATRAELQYLVDPRSSASMLALILSGLDGWDHDIGDFLPEALMALVTRRLMLTDSDTIKLKVRVTAAELPPYLKQLADRL